MYGFCYVTIFGETAEDIEKKVDAYRKYPFFTVGDVFSTEDKPKIKRQGKFFVVVNYFNVE